MHGALTFLAKINRLVLGTTFCTRARQLVSTSSSTSPLGQSNTENELWAWRSATSPHVKECVYRPGKSALSELDTEREQEVTQTCPFTQWRSKGSV